MIKKNIGTPDRWLRFICGAILLACAYAFKSWLALIGGLFCFFESYMSWCVLYQILGRSSCPIKKK